MYKDNEIMISQRTTSNILIAKQSLVKSIVADKVRNPVYVLGRNHLAKELIKQLNVVAVIDDFENTENEWLGLPIVRTVQLSNVTVVNCSISIYPRTAEQNIQKIKGVTSLKYSDFYNLYPDVFCLPEPMLSRHKDYKENKRHWQNVLENLADEESKTLFENIVAFNSSSDYAHLSMCDVAPNKQYFEDFMEYDHEIFVDAGGYIGDTTELFCNYYPNYREVYVFEPSPENMAVARNNLKSYANVTLVEKGLSDQTGILNFNASSGSASAVTDNIEENISIETTTIDDYFDTAVTFIKMDLEGWEPKALSGAKEMITKYTPKLAISVYHNANDMWAIYEQIMSYNSNYQVYLRHYTEGWSETIMYFKPTK